LGLCPCHLCRSLEVKKEYQQKCPAKEAVGLTESLVGNANANPSLEKWPSSPNMVKAVGLTESVVGIQNVGSTNAIKKLPANLNMEEAVDLASNAVGRGKFLFLASCLGSSCHMLLCKHMMTCVIVPM
jgi:hypothetical protein